MVKEKVLTGKYKACPIVNDHIKSFDGEEIYFNSFSVMNMEPAIILIAIILKLFVFN
jgi:hypothetical protein